MTGEPVGRAWMMGDAVPPQSPAQDVHFGVSAACGPPMPDPASTRASASAAPGWRAPWLSRQGAASMASASVAEPLQQLRAGPAIAAAIQTWTSSAKTRTIFGQRIDRTPGFNGKPRAGGLCEINRQRKGAVSIAGLQLRRRTRTCSCAVRWLTDL